MRLFIAIPLPEKLQTNLAKTLPERSKMNTLGIRPSEAGNIHITLKFLGEVEKTRIPAVTTAIQVAAAGIPAFEIMLTQGGCFPNRSQPRILWIGGNTPDALCSLVTRLEEECCKIRFEPESKPFRLHATLARIQPYPSAQSLIAIDETLKKLDCLPLTSFHVDQVILFKSDLSSGKPRYASLFTQKLDFVLRSKPLKNKGAL